jgi:hypothetical protein
MQCCQFLRFQLTVEAAGGRAVLDVTGSAGSQESSLNASTIEDRIVVRALQSY